MSPRHATHGGPQWSHLQLPLCLVPCSQHRTALISSRSTNSPEFPQDPQQGRTGKADREGQVGQGRGVDVVKSYGPIHQDVIVTINIQAGWIGNRAGNSRLLTRNKRQVRERRLAGSGPVTLSTAPLLLAGPRITGVRGRFSWDQGCSQASFSACQPSSAVPAFLFLG